MMEDRPLIIKFGGSVLTDKLSEGVINYQALSELSAIISRVRQPLVLIHGAGSLGHPEAKKWKIADGVTRENAAGIAETHEAVSRLNQELVKMLRGDGITAVPFPPFASSFASGRRLQYAGENQIAALLKAGITPVLYGDTVMDERQGACIVSGDQLVQYLARALHACRVGLVTDVGGVLQDDAVIPEITPETVDRIVFTESGCADVTGGMRGKVDELLELARAGISSQVFSIDGLADFLVGGNPGTRITAGA
ncbi:MAG TPA: isopentenyl phosphate kinase, partial [Methanocorpusculum sp.]|nr:isopentenyl phosphate kinase [Methanocorpusculum sp.]